MKKKIPSGVRNFYSELPDKFKPKYHNPNFEHHMIKIPFRMLIVAASGGGKTNLLLDLISRMSDTFEQIDLCVKNKHEPLYEYLEEKIPQGLNIYEGIENIPPLDKADKSVQKLIVFDDMVNEDQKLIQEYFIRSRKLNYCCAYLSQSYYKTPKLIRQNINYLAILKLSSIRDLKRILSEYNLGVDIDQLKNYYLKATESKMSCLVVDIDAGDGERFRKNFIEQIG